jgi:hypothetical protein
VSSILREKEKFQQLLSDFVGEQAGALRWNLKLTKGAGSVENSSNSSAAARAQAVGEIEAHPALQSLQKIFPGSKVEQVKVKN